jgi:hypothetical protein
MISDLGFQILDFTQSGDTLAYSMTCQYRKLFCPHCQHISIEDLGLFDPYLRVTTRLALYIYQLCHFMPTPKWLSTLAWTGKRLKTSINFI